MELARVTLDDKYALESGRVYLTGIQALTRLLIMQRQRDAAAGLDTAGFVSGYQGSPLNAMDQTLWGAAPHLARHHIHFQPGQNEELAVTAVWGSQQVNLFRGARYDGVFALWYGKWAGVGRCGDAFNHGNSAGASPTGGVLLVCGDDHAARSSTVCTQSEHMLIAPMIPVLAPAGVQDYLDLGLHGWAMSRFSGSWVGLKALDDTVECSASVHVDPHRTKVVLPEGFGPPGSLGIRLPDQPGRMERRIHEWRLPAVQAYARANGLDRIVWASPRARLGIAAPGKSFLDVRQALDHLGIGPEDAQAIGIRLLKIGMSWPLDPVTIAEFADGLEEILVVEEKRPLIEGQIREYLYDQPEGGRPRIVGKREGAAPQAGGPAQDWLLPPNGEFNPEQIGLVIARRLARFHTSDHIDRAVAFLTAKEEARTRPSLSPQLRGYLSDAGRVPYFCSGCPHNTSTRLPEGSEAIAGVGCHFMASYIFPDTKIFSHMGAEGAVWVGQAPFTERQHIFANLGDGTYHHSGLLAIRAAVAANVNITFKILYNDATAATGGQPLPAPMSVPAITRQLDAEGLKVIVVVTDEPDKYAANARFAPQVKVRHRDELEKVQRELREVPGVTAIVYDQTCASEKRRRRKRGAFPDPAKRSFINTRVCEGCGDCNVKSNCVSVLPLETEFGRKRRIDQSSCNKDFSCLKGFCPSYVTVEGGSPRRGSAMGGDGDVFAGLPEPTLPALDRPYGMVIAGVGGTGVITVGALVGMAAHLEGKGVSTLDVTGVAQKGGAVTTDIRIAKAPEELHSIRVAAGEANAILGCDLVVTVENEVMVKMQRGLTRAVVNTNRQPTVAFIRNPDLETPWTQMEDGLADALGSEHVGFVDTKRLASLLMGDAIYANIFLLGFAYQKALVPVSGAAILRAIELNAVAVEANRRAFLWGRLAAEDRERVERMAEPAAAIPGSDQRLSKDLDESIERRRAYLTDYQDAAYAGRYAGLVERVRAAEAPFGGTRLTEAVARNYFKLLTYKDEYEVARLYTDGEFLRQVRSSFDGDFRLRFHFAPPLLAKPDPVTGEATKRPYGPWILPVLRVLAKLRRLRGTPFDLFGMTEERRAERQLIRDYERTVETLLEGLAPEKLALAAEIAAVPEAIRGFGHVKRRNLDAARAKEAALLAEYRSAAPAQPAIAAE